MCCFRLRYRIKLVQVLVWSVLGLVLDRKTGLEDRQVDRWRL